MQKDMPVGNVQHLLGAVAILMRNGGVTEFTFTEDEFNSLVAEGVAISKAGEYTSEGDEIPTSVTYRLDKAED